MLDFLAAFKKNSEPPLQMDTLFLLMLREKGDCAKHKLLNTKTIKTKFCFIIYPSFIEDI
jgi:hypothetical protein